MDKLDGDGDDDGQQWWSTMMMMLYIYVICLSPEEVWALQVQKLTRKGMANLRGKKTHLKSFEEICRLADTYVPSKKMAATIHDPFINRRLLQIISNPKSLRGNLSTISLSISHVQPGKATHSDSEAGSQVGIAS